MSTSSLVGIRVSDDSPYYEVQGVHWDGGFDARGGVADHCVTWFGKPDDLRTRLRIGYLSKLGIPGEPAELENHNRYESTRLVSLEEAATDWITGHEFVYLFDTDATECVAFECWPDRTFDEWIADNEFMVARHVFQVLSMARHGVLTGDTLLRAYQHACIDYEGASGGPAAVRDAQLLAARAIVVSPMVRLTLGGDAFTPDTWASNVAGLGLESVKGLIKEYDDSELTAQADRLAAIEPGLVNASHAYRNWTGDFNELRRKIRDGSIRGVVSGGQVDEVDAAPVIQQPADNRLHATPEEGLQCEYYAAGLACIIGHHFWKNDAERDNAVKRVVSRHVVDVLTGARALIRDKGWIQGDGCRPEGHPKGGGNCLTNALAVQYDHLGGDVVVVAEAIRDARALLVEALGLPRNRWDKLGMLIGWNDSNVRTREEVIDALDAAIKLARERCEAPSGGQTDGPECVICGTEFLYTDPAFAGDKGPAHRGCLNGNVPGPPEGSAEWKELHSFCDSDSDRVPCADCDSDVEDALDAAVKAAVTKFATGKSSVDITDEDGSVTGFTYVAESDPYPLPTTPPVLRAAIAGARERVERGWLKGGEHKEHDGCHYYCVTGAVDAAVAEQFDGVPAWRRGRIGSDVIELLHRLVYGVAEDSERVHFRSRVQQWNDAPGVGKGEVLAVLDDAADAIDIESDEENDVVTVADAHTDRPLMRNGNGVKLDARFHDMHEAVAPGDTYAEAAEMLDTIDSDHVVWERSLSQRLGDLVAKADILDKMDRRSYRAAVQAVCYVVGAIGYSPIGYNRRLANMTRDADEEVLRVAVQRASTLLRRIESFVNEGGDDPWIAYERGDLPDEYEIACMVDSPGDVPTIHEDVSVPVSKWTLYRHAAAHIDDILLWNDDGVRNRTLFTIGEDTRIGHEVLWTLAEVLGVLFKGRKDVLQAVAGRISGDDPEQVRKHLETAHAMLLVKDDNRRRDAAIERAEHDAGAVYGRHPRQADDVLTADEAPDGGDAQVRGSDADQDAAGTPAVDSTPAAGLADSEDAGPSQDAPAIEPLDSTETIDEDDDSDAPDVVPVDDVEEYLEHALSCGYPDETCDCGRDIAELNEPVNVACADGFRPVDVITMPVDSFRERGIAVLTEGKRLLTEVGWCKGMAYALPSDFDGDNVDYEEIKQHKVAHCMTDAMDTATDSLFPTDHKLGHQALWLAFVAVGAAAVGESFDNINETITRNFIENYNDHFDTSRDDVLALVDRAIESLCATDMDGDTLHRHIMGIAPGLD